MENVSTFVILQLHKEIFKKKMSFICVKYSIIECF